MRNTIATIVCLVIAVVLISAISLKTFAKIEESDERVALLEGRVEELVGENKQLNNGLTSLKGAFDQRDAAIHTISDAIKDLKGDDEEDNDAEATSEVTYDVVEEEKAAEQAATEEPTTETPAEDNGGNGMTLLGTYELTAYCATGNPCADGVYPCENHTIACNNPMIWHRWVYIEGYGTYYCHDTGGMTSDYIIDVFVGSYDEAILFGRRSANIYLID